MPNWIRARSRVSSAIGSAPSVIGTPPSVPTRHHSGIVPIGGDSCESPGWDDAALTDLVQPLSDSRGGCSMARHQREDRGAVVVTGTSTGIGAATAIHLAEEGFQVFAGVRREED